MFTYRPPEYAALVRSLRAAINAAGHTVIAYVGAATIRRCPVDTGRMKGSIRYRWDDATMTGTVIVDVHYAFFVEYGTIHQKAQPFLWVSMEESTSMWPAALRGVSYIAYSSGGTVKYPEINEEKMSFTGTI